MASFLQNLAGVSAGIATGLAGWKKAEQEADDDIKQGRLNGFSSVDAFLADLKA